MSSNVQVHRQVLLNDAKISEETKTVQYNFLQKNDPISSKGDKDIGQTDLIKMHIATRPCAAKVVA